MSVRAAVRFLCPFGAGSRRRDLLHGLRSVRLSADSASPVATTLRSVGAKNAKRWQSGCEPGKKCRLQIDHVIPISQGGTDEEDNLRAVCVYYNKDKADVIRPASGQAISALAAIRKLPRSVQEEVYRFLAEKFGNRK